MRPRGCKIAIISVVVFFLNLQRIDLMFLRERMIEDFSQESENLVFFTCLLMWTRQRQEELGPGQDCKIGFMYFWHPVNFQIKGETI